MVRAMGSHWALQLAGYRREVAETYADVRAAEGGADAWQAWRTRRDRLIGTHPQSPLPADRRTGSWTTPFFDHDPAMRLTAPLRPVDQPARFQIPHSGDGVTTFTEVGTVDVLGSTLTVFWLDAYGGGLFLPFRDATCGEETYGGGRYLLDTVKGADLGTTADGDLVLDLNHAYHPSCAWDAAWSCPLAPATNVIDVAVRAGERLPLG